MDDLRIPPGMKAPKGVEKRHTERSDADNNIDKEDLERHRRGKKNTDDQERRDIYDDLAQVSTSLLRGFLENLLDTKDRIHDTRRDHAIRGNPAVQAYQTAKFMGNDAAPPPPKVNDDVEVAGFSRIDLAAESLDQNEIKYLISSLTHLEQGGIYFVEMQRSDSFLTSIKEAIDRTTNPEIS